MKSSSYVTIPITISLSIYVLSIIPNILCTACSAEWYLVIARVDLNTHWLCNSFDRWNYNFCWFTWNKTSLPFYIILFKQQKNIIKGNATGGLEKTTNLNQVARKLNSNIIMNYAQVLRLKPNLKSDVLWCPPRQRWKYQKLHGSQRQKRDHDIAMQENVPDACQIVVKDSTLVIRLSSQMHSLSKDLPR